MRRAPLLLAAAALAGGALAAIPSIDAGAADVAVTDGCVASVPEPGSTDPVGICYTLFRPAGATAEHPVPMVLHSHGWAGSRTTSADSFAAWFDAGFGVLSFDQRGFGASGGQAHVENPDFEGQDVQRIVDLVAGLDWVAHEAPGDPVLGAIGGSYGGGYQLVGAFTELRDRGATRFDALAPEITWFDLRQSLAPQGVVRTAWVTALYAAGADAHTGTVHEGFLYGATTGQWPDGSDPGEPDLNGFFRENGPHWHQVQGRLLDIPVLFGQGTTDNLFNLSQGLLNFDLTLTPEARAESIFVGYNGGHALPTVLPAGTSGAGDPCSAELAGDGGSFGALARRFFTEELLGVDTGLGGRGLYHLATPAGRCVTVDSITADRDVELADILTTAGVGVPTSVAVADGPLTIAGRPTLDADVTTLTPDARVFLALSVGPSPEEARVVADNMQPMREPDPVAGAHRFLELPAVAVDVPEGQHLYLTVSPISDLSFGHGSRVPGPVTLANPVVHLPTA